MPKSVRFSCWGSNRASKRKQVYNYITAASVLYHKDSVQSKNLWASIKKWDIDNPLVTAMHGSVTGIHQSVCPHHTQITKVYTHWLQVYADLVHTLQIHGDELYAQVTCRPLHTTCSNGHMKTWLYSDAYIKIYLEKDCTGHDTWNYFCRFIGCSRNNWEWGGGVPKTSLPSGKFKTTLPRTSLEGK